MFYVFHIFTKFLARAVFYFKVIARFLSQHYAPLWPWPLTFQPHKSSNTFERVNAATECAYQLAASSCCRSMLRQLCRLRISPPGLHPPREIYV